MYLLSRDEQPGDDRAGRAGVPDGAARTHAVPRVQDPPQGGGHGAGQRVQGKLNEGFSVTCRFPVCHTGTLRCANTYLC